MIVRMESSELLRIINRHKARTLAHLEEIHCPAAYLDAIRVGFDRTRSDLVSETLKHTEKEG